MANAPLASRLSTLERALPANDGIDHAAIERALTTFCAGIVAVASSFQVLPMATDDGLAQVAALRPRR